MARQVTPKVWDQIKALGLPGIFSEQTSRRVYPAGGLASNVIGFVGQDGAGLGGLELGWQQQLAGKSGVHIFEAGAGGREIPSASSEETDPVPGVDLRLTIDRDIQWVAQQALAAAGTGRQGRQRHGRRHGPAHRRHPRAGDRADVRPDRPGSGRRRPTAATGPCPTSTSRARPARS